MMMAAGLLLLSASAAAEVSIKLFFDDRFDGVSKSERNNSSNNIITKCMSFYQTFSYG